MRLSSPSCKAFYTTGSCQQLAQPPINLLADFAMNLLDAASNPVWTYCQFLSAIGYGEAEEFVLFLELMQCSAGVHSTLFERVSGQETMLHTVKGLYANQLQGKRQKIIFFLTPSLTMAFHLRSKTFQVDPKMRQTGTGLLIHAEGPGPQTEVPKEVQKPYMGFE